jgi:S1-C subfamily serine protease
VVMIKVNGGEGTGSGFIIAGGYIVTDNHVVTLDGQVSGALLQVVFNGGRQMDAKLIGRDPFSDIAVIKPDGGTGLPAMTLGDSASVEVGDPVIAIGSPLGLAGTVTSGIVSALDRPVQPGAGSGNTPQVFYDAIQTDAPINPGNSGGPLVNGQGQVIGVDAAIDTLGSDPLTGTQGGSIGLGFAIPINQVRIVAAELIRTGHAAHAVIGALINVDYRGTGAQIVTSRAPDAHAVTPGGPAARAGLRPGDVIASFGGQLIGSAVALLDAIRSRQPGGRVLVTFTRKSIARTVTLTLGSATS